MDLEKGTTLGKPRQQQYNNNNNNIRDCRKKYEEIYFL